MNDIILNVDTANNGTTTEETFSLVRPEEGKATYMLDGSALADKEQLTLFASLPKRSGNFLGVVRSSVKATKAISVPSTVSGEDLTSEIIAQVNFSVPEGTTLADLVHIRQRLVAMLDSDALMLELNQRANVFVG